MKNFQFLKKGNRFELTDGNVVLLTVDTVAGAADTFEKI